MPRASVEFIEWIKWSLEYAVECLDVSDGEVVVLFGMESGQRHVIKVEYLGDQHPVEGRISSGRDLISNSDDNLYYALIWSGQGPDITGKKYVDVVAVETGSRSGESSFLTQPYKLAKDHSLVRVGGPLISTVKIENMWHPELEESAFVDDSDDESDDGEELDTGEEDGSDALNELVEHVFAVAVERRQEGNETPFACLTSADDDSFDLIDPNTEDASTDEIIDVLRQHVATVDDSELYSIAYFSIVAVQGKNVNAIIVEAGVRDGEAPVFGLPYRISKSGKIKIEEVEYLEEGENLWGEPEEEL